MGAPTPPLHVLESARNNLDRLFGSGGCCMFDVDADHHHYSDEYCASDSVDRQAVIDVLDREIETRRRERERLLYGVPA